MDFFFNMLEDKSKAPGEVERNPGKRRARITQRKPGIKAWRWSPYSLITPFKSSLSACSSSWIETHLHVAIITQQLYPEEEAEGRLVWDFYLAETLKSQNPLNVQYVKDLLEDKLHENEKN